MPATARLYRSQAHPVSFGDFVWRARSGAVFSITTHSAKEARRTRGTSARRMSPPSPCRRRRTRIEWNATRDAPLGSADPSLEERVIDSRPPLFSFFFFIPLSFVHTFVAIGALIAAEREEHHGTTNGKESERRHSLSASSKNQVLQSGASVPTSQQRVSDSVARRSSHAPNTEFTATPPF